MDSPEIVIALNGGIETDGSLNPDTKSRVDKAMMIARSEGIERTAMVGGNAVQMREYAMRMYPDVNDPFADDDSRDTIGNAHFAKKNILEPKEIWRVRLVTARYHLPRSLWTFEHVLGRGYEIEGTPAETPYKNMRLAKLRAVECGLWAASAIMLAGIDPEDDDRREQRLMNYSSRYGGKNPFQRFVGFFDSAVKR